MKRPNLTDQIRRSSSWNVAICLAWIGLTGIRLPAQETRDLDRAQVTNAMHRAVTFFRENVAVEGGYVYQLSADLSKREGEGKVGPTTAWIEPPGTPAVGMAYLRAYQRCKDPLLLDSARETANALRRGQLESGGWDNRIEFADQDRNQYAYRVDKTNKPTNRLRNTSTFDDNKSQSALRFLMHLDQELDFADPQLSEMIEYALESVLNSQYPNGAWPQRFSELPELDDFPIRKASIPEIWSRTFPGHRYADLYTLNDNTISDLIATLLDAWDIYRETRYLDAAIRGGEFLILAQLPEPQPGWAQQYDKNMHPAWARKFEPPAVTGGESQQVMQTLMLLYRRTASFDARAKRFLAPLPRAIEYYRQSQLADGKLARFYELNSNRPLFFNRDYELTYSSDNLPTHYGFIVSSKLDQIERELNYLRSVPEDHVHHPKTIKQITRSTKLDAETAAVISALDPRGAWVEEGRLQYHGEKDQTREVIRTKTFVQHLDQLARWLQADLPNPQID